MNPSHLLLSALLLLFPALPLSAAEEEAASLRVAGIFGDRMVLQQETQAPIWGTIEAGAEVTIQPSWSKTSQSTRADDNGRWRAVLETPSAGGPFQVSVTSGEEGIKFSDVLTGEVWICSGQSNMQWKMRGFGVDEFKDDVARAKFPQIRYCSVPQVLALEKQTDTKASWSTCSPQTVLNYSAVAYIFGARLHEELEVPIELISTNWGGSSAEAWIREETLSEKFPAFRSALANQVSRHHGRLRGDIFSAKESTKGSQHDEPDSALQCDDPPIVPFAMRGVIWYQGESNVREPEQYRELFPTLITDWRKEWQRGDFPFYYVQIAPFVYKQEPKPVALLREAQLMALEVSNTGMAVTMDIGEATNIHPRAKKPVGERLALLALAKDYGRTDTVYSGPLFSQFKVQGNRIALAFDHLGGGLASRDGKPLTHFTIAGSDRKFHPAEAEISGDSIFVSSAEVLRPKAVRFGWGNADQPNLINKAGLPPRSAPTTGSRPSESAAPSLRSHSSNFTVTTPAASRLSYRSLGNRP